MGERFSIHCNKAQIVQIFYYFFIQMSNFNKLTRKLSKKLEIVYKSSIMMNIKNNYSP